MQALNKSYRVWIVLSNFSFDCGWNNVLKFTFFPRARWILDHNYEVILGFWLETIDIGTLCTLTTSLTYNSTNLSMEFLIL